MLPGFDFPRFLVLHAVPSVCSFCAMWFNEGCTRIETFVCNSRDECKTACCEALDEDESATSADMHGIQC